MSRTPTCRKVFAPFIGGAFFVTSEAFNVFLPRRFTVRYALDGKVDTVGKFQAFADRRTALAYAARCRDMADEFARAESGFLAAWVPGEAECTHTEGGAA